MDYLIGILLGRFFNVGPRVRKLNGALTADTAVPIAILTLGLKLRRVMIDPKQKAVRIFARYGWFVPRVRHIPFDFVQCVLYDYIEMNN